ncbi:MAG TPA: prepilin-type N-terminal cleavage/methylation domain-containing protein [Thermoanaerobaculia bacterium]|nr:prepilin-type N-terminal cleavage/methylation domain-containing protein [Thermoanaerobaculia bacterium]
MNRKAIHPIRCQAGFTLIELLVSLAVTAVLILGVLATFDFSARMNRVQLNVADMQQSLRIAQNEIVKLARMAGRGTLPRLVAIEVDNNVPANHELISGKAATGVLEGTDVLTIRGVFNSSLYQIDYLNPKVWSAPDADGDGSVLVLPSAAGVPQDLDALRLIATPEETLLLVTPDDVAAVAHILGSVDEPIEIAPGVIVIGVRISFTKHLEEGDLGPLAPGLPAVAQIGVLEEHVFYVRSTGADGVAPSLARARMDPGSDQAYEEDVANATLDIADNIADLQIALGFGVAGQPELRVNTLARTDRADPGKYLAAALPATIEDHAYPSNHPFNSDAGRRYRWRLMRTNVNMRNL